MAAKPCADLCAGCGEPLGQGRPNRRNHGPNCRKLALRARQRRAVEADVGGELLERARLGRQAIREGADPCITLSLVIWPPDTADDARELLRAAA